jgi:hypothetical protein
VGARREAKAWAGAVRELARARGLRYDTIGELNPRGAPAALCPGGTNRITGELAEAFWGASCDAGERSHGGLLWKATLPDAVLTKAHMPDLAQVVPLFNVESFELHPDDLLRKHTGRNRVEFESIEFNRRFMTSVPRDHDPVALRELFSPGFLDWVVGIEGEIDFGITDRQLYFMWRLRGRTAGEYERALGDAGELFRRLRREMEGAGVHTYPAGPWHAGLEPFPLR